MLRRALLVSSAAFLLASGGGLTSPAAGATVPGEGVPVFGNVFVIIGENTGLNSLTKNNMPYLINTMKPKSAWMTGYYANAHDSLANYIAMTSGQFTLCEQEDRGPADCHQNVPNLFGQLDSASLSWKSWMESMPAPCDLTIITGSDAGLNRQFVGHSPAVYYDGIEGAGGIWSDTNKSSECLQNVIPAGTTGPNDTSSLDSALASGNVARFNYIVPNLCEDAHDACREPNGNRIRQFDNFLAREIPKIENSPAFGSNGVIITLFDEGNSSSLQNADPTNPTENKGGNVLFTVDSPLVRPGVYGGFYNHYSFLRTLEDGFRLSSFVGVAAQASAINQIWQ